MGVGGATFSIRAAAAFVLLAMLAACSTLHSRTVAALNAPGLEGTSWGLVVMTMDGRELVAIRPDERFLPASNTKMFAVAAAFHRLGQVAQPDPSMGASVRIEPRADGPPDIVLAGGGDAMLIDADDCEKDCLSDLADMTVANGVKRVRHVFGDDTAFPDERWGPGWTQDDLIRRAGAPASALVVNSNEIQLVVSSGGEAGALAKVEWRPDDDVYELHNEIVTVAGEISPDEGLRFERLPGSPTVRAYGAFSVGAKPDTSNLAVEDPALSAAWRFMRLLRERGVVIEGQHLARHRPLVLRDTNRERGEGAAQPRSPGSETAGGEIARLLPPPLIDDLRFIMKQSQNLHAEVLLRRLGLIEGEGSRADGLAIVEATIQESGADRNAWDLSDGSGMSVYNRLTPRMVARFLRWTTQQPWGEAFRETMPIGGVDGTLSRRFRGASLEGRVFAKTGTLFGTNALSGFMLTRSGKTLIFSAYANDRPSKAPSATAAMDAALNAIATAN